MSLISYNLYPSAPWICSVTAAITAPITDIAIRDNDLQDLLSLSGTKASQASIGNGMNIRK